MEIIREKVEESDNYYTKQFFLNGAINVDYLVSLINQFEDADTKMDECFCDTFDKDGTSLHIIYNVVDDIAKVKELPNPSVRFSIRFCDRRTNNYKFSLSTSINSECFYFVVNKKRYEVENKVEYSRKV